MGLKDTLEQAGCLNMFDVLAVRMRILDLLSDFMTVSPASTASWAPALV